MKFLKNNCLIGTNFSIEFNKTLIMGIINITPDSFSDGGTSFKVGEAIEKAHRMVEDGADLIDVGGESTRPGADIVALNEELGRVIPVIEALHHSGLKVPISIDTYKAEVAKQALHSGAHIVNDIWGLKKDPEMAQVIVEQQCPVIIMHNRREAKYIDLIEDVLVDLQESIQLAHLAGVQDQQIILDPGIGFAKTITHNLTLMNHLHFIVELGYPVVLGTSRKSMIQRTLSLPADQVWEGTAATVALGISQGCHIMRVHDVAQMKKVAMMSDAIVRI